MYGNEWGDSPSVNVPTEEDDDEEEEEGAGMTLAYGVSWCHKGPILYVTRREIVVLTRELNFPVGGSCQ